MREGWEDTKVKKRWLHGAELETEISMVCSGEKLNKNKIRDSFLEWIDQEEQSSVPLYAMMSQFVKYICYKCIYTEDIYKIISTSKKSVALRYEGASWARGMEGKAITQ